MGESCYFVQNVQLYKGGQNPGRSGYAYQSQLERLITKELIQRYENRGVDIVIHNDVYCYIEVQDIGIRLEFLRYAFGDFKKLTVNRFGLHVSYS
jgi:hypothetical protein